MTQTEPSNPEDAIRVLHVDDEHNPLKFTKSFVELSDSTIHMESIATPEAALRRLEEENFDCVVSDYQMPILNGIELARRIRGFSDIPIIIYTGRGSEEVASKAFAAGIDDYMRKEIEPSHYEVLARRIRAAVEKHMYERRLGESVNQFRVLFDGIPEAILLIDPKDYTIIRANKAAFEHPWKEEADVIGRPCYEITHQRSSPCEPPDHPCPIRELLETGMSTTEVHLHHDRDGNELYEEVSVFPVMDDAGRIVNVVHCSRNISVKKSMERDLLLVNQLNESVNRGDSLQEIVGQLARETGRNFSSYGTSVYLVSEDGEHLVLQNQTLPQPLLNSIEKLIGRSILKVEIPLKPGSLYSEILGSSPQIIQEPERIRRLIADCTENVVLKRLAPQIYSALGIKSVIVAPLVSEGETIGLLDLSRSKPFGELDLERIRHIASQVATIIKRKHIEGDLLLERDKAQRYLDVTSVILVALDAEGRVTLLNRQGCELLGWTKEEAIGRDWFESFLPEWIRDEVKRVFGKLLSGDIEPVEYHENPVLTINGEERLIGWYNTLLRDSTGEITGTLSSGIDITERKKMEEELRESEARFRGFLESGMDGVSLVIDDKLVYLNKRGAELLGYDYQSELIGMESIEIVHPSSRHVMLRRKELRGQGDTKPARYEVEMLRKDGSTFHAEVLSSVIDYEGKPARLAFTRDITERKLYEKRMEALHRHAAELNKVKTMKEAYELTLDAMETSLDFSRGTFLVVEGENLIDVMLRGLDEDRPFTLPLDGKGLTVKAMRTGESVLVPDVSLDPDYIDVGVGINFELAVPVKIDGVAVAVLNTESTELGGYTEQDQVILEVLAEHVSFAMKRIIDETERARYRDRLEAIHGYAPEIAQAETLEEIGEKTFDAIESVLGFDLGSLGVVEGDLLRHVYIRGFEGGETFEMPLDMQGVTVTAVRTGETQLIPDVSKCEGYVIGIADGLREPKSELAVPVFVEDVPSGVINVESTRLDAFTEEDRGLLEIFAGHVGSALLRLKQMEELRVSEEKYQSLLESTMDAVVVNDEERYLYANAKAAELLGFEDPSSLVGRRFVEFFAPEFRELVATRARERLEGGCPINRYSFTMLRVDGSPVEVEANVNVVDYQGKPAVLAVLRNITERKRMEEELLTYSMDLESRIEERTRELLDAERMAAAGSVAAMVGHDLRSPLQSIKNAAYFLRKSPESFDESLRVIDDSVDRATKMIEELRDQTREDPITFTTKVDLGAMMAKAVEEAILPEGVNAVVEVGDGLESVLVDASKFRRVMDNLIRNAVEAMPKGGELRVEARLNVGEVLVEVSDTGVGMPEEVMGELFKPFYTMKAGGLGLGLAYCKRAVEAHGGTIEVESEIDKRTTFTIRLHNEHE